MQIDFHHGVTYVVARLAGFPHEPAQTVAYSAQYVDDATNDGYIAFDNRSMYYRIASAHKMLDYKNFDELANHHAWISFHFLPGNGGLAADQGEDLAFVQKIVCRPNSYVARDMVRECIARRGDAHALHRLGIAMHVYADTWAHQGFAGISHEVNHTFDLKDAEERTDHSLRARVKDFFGDAFDTARSRLVGNTMPLGHGTVLSNPDKPFLRWSYTNGLGQPVTRDNPRDFLEAADNMCKAMRSFLAGDESLGAQGLPDGDRRTIDRMLRTTLGDNGRERHAAWLEAIRDGAFSFGAAELDYVAKGVNSWKYQALGTAASEDDKNQVFPYQSAFLRSDWKRFHDALQAHRLYVEHDLLPQYGICAA